MRVDVSFCMQGNFCLVSTFREADSSSASQEIPLFYRTGRFDTTHVDPVHAFLSYLRQI
jgi:hypothetical protein